MSRISDNTTGTLILTRGGSASNPKLIAFSAPGGNEVRRYYN